MQEKQRYQAVQFDAETNSTMTWIGKIKNGLKGVSSEADRTFKLFSQMRSAEFNKLKEDNFQEFIKNNKLTDKNLITFLENPDYIPDLTSYQQYLEDTGNATLNLSSITQKAGSVLKSFGATLGSMLTMWAVSKGIEFLITELDNAADSVADVEARIKENQNILSGYTSKIEELTEKLQDLNETDTTYLSDTEKKNLETESAYIKSQLELYDQLAAAKEKAINEDYIKAVSGKNEEVAIKKLWEEIINGEWEEAAHTFGEANGNHSLYDFLLPGFGSILSNVDDGNYISEADKLLDEYEKLQYKYNSIQQFAIKNGNSEELDQALEETKSSITQTTAELAGYIEEIQTARNSLADSRNKDEYADIIAELDQSVAEYQKILNANTDTGKYSGFSDLQRNLIGIRDVIQAISTDLNDLPLLEPLLKSMDVLTQIIDMLDCYSLSEISDLSKIVLKNKLDEVNSSFQSLRETLGDGEFLDSLRDKLSNVIPNELIEDMEKLQNFIALINAGINSLIKRIGDKTGLSDILNGLSERLSDISSVFSGFMNKFGFIFEDAINAWNDAHQSYAPDVASNDTDYKDDTTDFETDYSSSIPKIIDRFNTQIKPVFDSLKSAWQDIFTADGNFTPENVDLSMLGSIKSAIDKLNSMEDADINIGYSSFENLAKVLTDTSSTADDVKNSMNALATDVINSLSPALSNCSGEQYLFLQSMLKSIGIINSEDVLISSLGYSYNEYIAAKEEAADAGFDLANATETEINDFVAEAIESGICGKALALLQLKKRLLNNTSINTSSDIQEIMNLVSIAYTGSTVLDKLANAKDILAQVEAGKPVSLASYEIALSDIENARKDILDWKPVEIDFTNLTDTKSASPSSPVKTAAEDAEKATKDYVDSYMSYMEASLDASIIDYQNYVREVSAFLKSMFDDGKIAAQDYFNYQKQMLETQKSIYDKVISAVTGCIDREIAGVQDTIDSIEEQNDSLQTQLDDYDRILSVVDSVYQKEIDSLNEQKEMLQDKIDAINEANDALDLQCRKEQAIYELKRAQEQRTKKVFNGTEFVYTADDDSIRQAQNDLQDIETEEIIKGLEAEQKQLEESAEALEKYRDLWAEISSAYDEEINVRLAVSMWGEDYAQLILSNRPSDIESFRNKYISTQKTISANQELIDSYNEKIEYYETLKEQWSSVTDAYEQEQSKQYAAMILGAEWESEVLSGRLDTLSRFRDEYISIQKSIADAALEYANAQKELNLAPADFLQRLQTEAPCYSSMVKLPEIYMPKYDFTPVNRDNSTSISIGDIHLHEVQNVDSLANAIIRDLPNKALQAMHKRR